MGGKVLDALRDLFCAAGSSNSNVDRVTDISLWTPADFEKATDLLKTRKIVYEPQRGKIFTRVVVKVYPESVSETKFQVEKCSDRLISVFEYFRDFNKITLQYPNGPLLECKGGSSPKIPAELCTIKTGQKRKLNDSDSSASQSNNAAPAVTAGKKRKKKNHNPLDLQQFISKAGLEFQDNWASWEPHFNFLRNGNETMNWGILNLTRKLSTGTGSSQLDLAFLAGQLVEKAASHGMEWPPSSFYKELSLEDTEDRRNENVDSLTTTFKEFRAQLGDTKMSFVLVILPKKGGQIYNLVKHAAEEDVKILTQCVVGTNIAPGSPNQRAIMEQILLKISIKLMSKVDDSAAPLPPFDFSEFWKVFQCPEMMMEADRTPPGSTIDENDQDGKIAEMETLTVNNSVGDATVTLTGMDIDGTDESTQAASVVTGLDSIFVKVQTNEDAGTKGNEPFKIITGDGMFQEVRGMNFVCTKTFFKGSYACY